MTKCFIFLFLILLNLSVQSQEGRASAEKELIKIIHGNYKALSEKNTAKVLQLYHPKSNILTPKKVLDDFLSKTDTKYEISNIRFIGEDGENFVVIYQEVTEFRKRGQKELIEKVETDVLLVFRRHEGKLKVFTSRSLIPKK